MNPSNSLLAVQPRLTRCLTAFATVAVGLLAAGVASAATSKACTGGGFSALGRSGKVKIELPASQLPASFLMKGKYVEFEVDTATLGVRNYVLTGAANELDMTGGVRTPVFASKLPDLGGIALTGNLEIELKDGDAVLRRKGGAVDMKIQAKDCAQGGLFQMEVERDDNPPHALHAHAGQQREQRQRDAVLFRQSQFPQPRRRPPAVR